MLGRHRGQQLTVPTLLLAGAHDFALSARAVAPTPANPGQLQVRVVDGGHYLPEEHAAVVAAAIREQR